MHISLTHHTTKGKAYSMRRPWTVALTGVCQGANGYVVSMCPCWNCRELDGFSKSTNKAYLNVFVECKMFIFNRREKTYILSRTHSIHRTHIADGRILLFLLCAFISIRNMHIHTFTSAHSCEHACALLIEISLKILRKDTSN